jgi:uncharacterized protein YehS (DUF1456 family)
MSSSIDAQLAKISAAKFTASYDTFEKHSFQSINNSMFLKKVKVFLMRELKTFSLMDILVQCLIAGNKASLTRKMEKHSIKQICNWDEEPTIDSVTPSRMSVVLAGFIYAFLSAKFKLNQVQDGLSPGNYFPSCHAAVALPVQVAVAYSQEWSRLFNAVPKTDEVVTNIITKQLAIACTLPENEALAPEGAAIRDVLMPHLDAFKRQLIVDRKVSGEVDAGSAYYSFFFGE